jgi:hypothetical protein
MVLQTGDAFVIDDPGVPPFLWVVLHGQAGGSLLIAPVRSINPKTIDDACLVEAGDHPRIRERSFVDYQFARLLAPDELKRLDRFIVRADEVPGALFDRIRTGAAKSSFLPRKFKPLV